MFAKIRSYARSQYRARLDGGSWRIDRITSIFERGTLIASMPGTRLGVDVQDLAGYRPSYRCLAWYLSQRGLQLRPDLLGDEQPEAVARQYEAEAAWLAGAHRSAGVTGERGETEARWV